MEISGVRNVGDRRVEPARATEKIGQTDEKPFEPEREAKQDEQENDGTPAEVSEASLAEEKARAAIDNANTEEAKRALNERRPMKIPRP